MYVSVFDLIKCTAFGAILGQLCSAHTLDCFVFDQYMCM